MTTLMLEIYPYLWSQQKGTSLNVVLFFKWPDQDSYFLDKPKLHAFSRLIPG